MTYQPDLAKARLGAFAGLEGIRAVGWLSGDFEFSNGEVPDLLLERLGAYWRALHPGIDDPDRGILVPIAAAGRHACGLCLQGGVQPFQDSMEMYIADGDGGGFEAPSMIVHYIQTHRYRPPQPFVDAVLAYASTEAMITAAHEASVAVLERHGEITFDSDPPDR